jgi:3-oxoacyl-[acyl-carrier protein] reductase
MIGMQSNPDASPEADRLKRLKGKVALVTGAGSGIGRAIAEALILEGAKVAVNDIEAAKVRVAVNRFVKLGGEAIAVIADVSNETEVRRMVRKTIQTFSRIDILVNNAGIFSYAPVARMPIEMWDRMIAVHLRGTFLCTRYVLPLMLRAGSGKVINIVSQRGQKGGRESAHYSAAKAGVIGFTKSLALEVSRRNINVNAIAPGPIKTRRHTTARFKQTVRGLPIGKAGTTRDVALTAVFLVCDDSRFYVGQTLCPNGGDVML